jgi:hypothetical protein
METFQKITSGMQEKYYLIPQSLFSPLYVTMKGIMLSFCKSHKPAALDT